MTQFPGAMQPALGIQDAAMLPAQTAGNLFIQRLAAAEAAFVPTTQTFDSTTSSTVLNSTTASTGGGSLRSLMMPVNTANFVPIVPNPSPAFYNGPLYAQFGDQQLTAAILAGQTAAGSMAGRAILNACGVHYSGSCGCGCTPELSETTVIDEDNTNGIDDGAEPLPRPQPPVYAPPASVQLADAEMMCQGAQTAAPAANVQYVTYNA